MRPNVVGAPIGPQDSARRINYYRYTFTFAVRRPTLPLAIRDATRSAGPISGNGISRSTRASASRSRRDALQFRSEFFNILNHTNFATPDHHQSVPPSGPFAAPSAAPDPVRPQAALVVLESLWPLPSRAGTRRPLGHDIIVVAAAPPVSASPSTPPRAATTCCSWSRRLRQGHLQPQHQTGPRRRALSRAGQHLARHGSPEGTRPPAQNAPAPG